MEARIAVGTLIRYVLPDELRFCREEPDARPTFVLEALHALAVMHEIEVPELQEFLLKRTADRAVGEFYGV